ncbi:YdeI/OmpD-associated family protein [Mucilaginibacter achroorhodeus]|uniref:YdeI/OmpD-associated family protein n=1 Tax=Mucilaginibacter achroorhodeus TaxID=2599294 RepID=A0A563U1S2_9SPHI|nr:YdeI/OmpD-associated family protein [Mucilaginibacter achroorhodeus]TWR25523.1 YdeI/OmpD-associated family protein [Mucilaginibacter achroorhodeus]
MTQSSPLAKKLQMKPGQTWLILNAPEDYLATLEPLPDGVELTFAVGKPVSGIQVFVKTGAELSEVLKHLKPSLKDDTIFWVIYPKKTSGIETDLEMMSGWEVTKPFGLRPVASAAINNVWTSLRFRPEHLVKHSEGSAASIRKENDYSEFIDVDKRQITLPPYLQEALAAEPAAMAYYEKLAWSHRKEYVLWILSAKQEQTRANRIVKMMEMLLAGKKNPSDK